MVTPLDRSRLEATLTHDVSRRGFLRLAAAASVAPSIATAAGTAPDGRQPARPESKTVCVLGASGTVGNGIVRELLSAGHRVVAVSRSSEKLEQIRARYASTGRVNVLVGDVSSDDLAYQLRDRVVASFGAPDAVVAPLSAHSADVKLRILDTPTQQLKDVFDTNFFTHVTAARALLPALTPGGTYLGINGGLASFVVPGMGHISMTQSALGTLYTTLAQEAKDEHSRNAARVHVLSLFGLVANEENRARIDEGWLTDQQVGRRVVEIIGQPDAFPGVVLAIKAKRYA